MTKRQSELLAYITRYWDEFDCAPSFDEMMAALRLKSKSGVHRLVSQLEARGYVRRSKFCARSVEVTRAPNASPVMHPGDLGLAA